jgi:hypothetical protein
MAETKDVMDTPPLERMDKLDQIKLEKTQSLAKKKKELEELEEKKRKEIELLDKRKRKELEDLEDKKKEFEKLEQDKAKEITETDDLIEQSFQDLMRHKHSIIDAEESQKNLEARTVNAPSMIPNNVDYGRFFEKLEIPDKLYDTTNSGFYNNLTELKKKAMTGDLTPQEETFVERLREKFETFSQPGYLQNRDDHNYVQRSMKLLQEIDVSLAYK